MPLSFATAFDRVRRLLASPEVRELRDPEADVIQIEEYIPGSEYALEGLVENGVLRTLAIFDKPDPLDGPFFEETIYVTPSRADAGMQQQIEQRGRPPRSRRSACSTARSTPSAASTAAACSCSKWRRGRSAACARSRSAMERGRQPDDWLRGVAAAACARRADDRAGRARPAARR